MEDQITQRKAEVEKLISEMREANMESLAISPPEESKQFLDGEQIFLYIFTVVIVFKFLKYFDIEICVTFPPFSRIRMQPM